MHKPIDRLFDVLVDHETKFNRAFSLIPSENALSPLARAAFLSDAFSRYFFDEHEVFGRWSFQGGSIAGRVQTEIVIPLLRELGKARFINVHPVSGLTGMTLALAAFGGEPGGTVVSVDPAHGGHPDTRYVANKLGYRTEAIPFQTWDRVDLDALGALVERSRPSLVYIDHATALFPLDLAATIRTIRAASSGHTHVHVDSSHVNGLIWGGELDNPLDCGADTYGGSTHKTFPGPHKAVLFTNDADIAERLTLAAVNMISHHHLSSVVALGIALIEFKECGGREYARQIRRNARAFAQALAERGAAVQGRGGEHTANHQVWVAVPDSPGAYSTASRLFDAGLVVNPYNPLPSLGGPGIRMGVNEPTRLGLTEQDMVRLAQAFASVAVEGRSPDAVAPGVGALRATAAPRYCFTGAEAAGAFGKLAAVLEDDRRLFVSGRGQRPAGSG